MIIRFIIYLLLFYLGLRLVRYLIDTGTSGRKRVFTAKPGEIDDVMIQDPVCQVYFPKREGVHVKKGGKDLYFCSTECRDKYLDVNTKETE